MPINIITWTGNLFVALHSHPVQIQKGRTLLRALFAEGISSLFYFFIGFFLFSSFRRIQNNHAAFQCT